ncbi:S-methyl thiohydantoin desulfurase domain-containing protein [Microbacterium sp. NPDC055599]
MRLERDDVAALARGYALLGSGGGGSTTMLELMLGAADHGPIDVTPVSALDPATPCLGVAFVGSTMLLSERMPGAEPFGALLRAVERWLGHPVPAVCSLEGGGMNGLAPLTLAKTHTVVDADCTGRAVPGLDQMSLFVDRVPGLVFACETGADGVALVEATRAIDAERVVRSAIIQAGGVGCAVLAGFTVGDLREHAIEGHLARALDLGRAFLAHARLAPPLLAEALGGELLAEGRILSVAPSVTDPHVSAIEVAGIGGTVHRVVARSETLAVLSDGLLVAAAPEVIVVLDAVSREILEVTDLSLARHVVVLALPAPEWWSERPERRARIVPSAYGLDGLDAA